MDWLFGDKTKKLSGSYAQGQKYFRCKFPEELFDSDKWNCSDKSTSGHLFWRLFTKKEKDEKTGKDDLVVQLKCALEDLFVSESGKNWNVEADYTIRILNSEKPDENIIFHNSTTFDNDKFWKTHRIGFDKLTDDFLKEGGVSFEVEVGVKSIEGVSKTENFYVKQQDDSDVVLVVNGIKLFVKKETLKAASPVFTEMFKESEGKTESTDHEVKDADPIVFRMLMDFLHGNPIGIQLESVENLIKLAERFKVKGIEAECAKYLKTSVVNDAEAVKLADKYKMMDVIECKLESLNTLIEIKSTFKYYRYFSDETMRLLIKKLLTVSC